MSKRMTIPVLFLAFFAVSAAAAGQEKSTKPLVIKPALLVIDIQNAFLPHMSEQDRKNAFLYIDTAMAIFREKGFPVILVYHTSPAHGPKPGTAEYDFTNKVSLRPDDVRIVKGYANAFKKTDLDKVLKEKGCNTLFLCGLSSTGCVLATYHGALDNDYRAFMIQNALIGPEAALTKAVESICTSISLDALDLLLEGLRR